MLQLLCYSCYVTVVMLQLLCYSCYVTGVMLQLLCYRCYVTVVMLQLLCYSCYVTVVMLQLLCYSCCVCISRTFLVINVCNQGKTLCSPCICKLQLGSQPVAVVQYTFKQKNTENSTKQIIHRATQKLGRVRAVPCLWGVLPWHLSYNWGKSTEKPQSG